MNHRKVPNALIETVYGQILNKIDKAQSKDAFYVCMSLGHGLGRKFVPEQIPRYSDVIYTLYLTVAREAKKYDLYQLS